MQGSSAIFIPSVYAKETSLGHFQSLMLDANFNWTIYHKKTDFLFDYPMMFGTVSSDFDESPMKFHSFLVGIDISKHFVVKLSMQGEVSTWFSNLFKPRLVKLMNKIETEMDLITLLTFLDTARVCRGCQPTPKLKDVAAVVRERGICDCVLIGKGL